MAKALVEEAERLNGQARDLLRALDLPAGQEIAVSDMLYRAMADLRTVTDVLRGKAELDDLSQSSDGDR